MKVIFLVSLLLASFAQADYQGLGSESIKPEVVAQFAPQPLDSALSKNIQTLLDVRAPRGVVLSQDGKNMFYNWRVTGVGQVWKLNGPMTFPIQMTGGEDNTKVVGITADGKWLIVMRDQNGEENPGLYLQSSHGGRLRKIFHQAKVQTYFGFSSEDSKKIYFTANNIKADSYALYRYDIENGKMDLLFNQDGLWFIKDHRRNGDILLTKATGSLWSEYYLWNEGENSLVPILGQGEKEEYEVMFSVRSGEYLVLTPKFGDFRRLYLFNKGKYQPITPEIKMDVSEFFIDQKRKRIYYTLNDGGYTRLEVLDAQTKKKLVLPKLPKADHVFMGYLSSSGDRFALEVETAQAPRMNFVYDWKTKEMVQWLVPSAPEVDLNKFVAASLEYYPARDGTPIPMFVRRPQGCEKKLCPVVVSFHGGPEGQSQPGFSIYTQLFIDAGFVMVMPNVRGSDGYGKEWINSDNGAKRLNVITDIEDCAKFIREKWKVDGKSPRIGIEGGSYGGYSTLIGMTMFAGAYDAGVSVVGMSSLVTFLQNTAPYRRILRESEYGYLEKDREVLQKLSPINYIDRIKDPLMIIQGVNDPRVPAGEAIQMYEALRKKKVDAELILFGDEGHGTVKRANQVMSIGHTIRFFQKHLKQE